MSSHFLLSTPSTGDPDSAWIPSSELPTITHVVVADSDAVYNGLKSGETLYVWSGGPYYLERNPSHRAAPNGYPLVESVTLTQANIWLDQEGYDVLT
jgi:hypothetical protein